MDWLDTANSLVALLGALVSLVVAGIGVYFGIKTKIASLKDKSKSDIWALIVQMTQKAMSAAEETGETGATKKQMVIDAVNAAAKEAGVDISDFTEQLSDFIDNSITFANTIKSKTTDK